MKKKGLFNLFLKTLSNGTKIYYYSCYDQDNKRRQFSTGKFDKQEAYAECYKRLAEGKIIVKSKMNFDMYTENWFIHEKCPYCTVRIAKGRKYSRSSMENKRKNFLKHIMPFFGKKRLDHITSSEIELWLQGLNKANYAVNTINNYLSILRLILGEANRTGLISRNPCDEVIRYSEKKKDKKILTDEEVEVLFDMDKIDEIWNGSRLHSLISKTAKITGCRIGEILALTPSELKDGYIVVDSSIDKKYGKKCCKAGEGSIRYVPVPDELLTELRELSLTTPGQYIFSLRDTDKPVSYATVLKKFKSALKKSGISEERLRQLGGLHMFRHYAITKLKLSGTPDSVVMAIAGHRSLSMSEHYTHVDPRTIPYESLKIV